MTQPWWNLFTGVKTRPTAKVRPQPLRVLAAGLCCSVGHELASAEIAISANVDHFQAGDFLTESGSPVTVARMPDAECWGGARLARWIAWGVRDCLATAAQLAEPHGAWSFESERCALVVVAPEAEREDMADIDYPGMLREATALLGLRFAPSSRVLPLGKAGLTEALGYGLQVCTTAQADSFLLVAADSLLEASLIDGFLRDERLLVPGNSDGFTPGEAAAAVLLAPAQQSDAGATMEIVAWASANEPAHWNSNLPNRAQGLTRALREALAMAGLEPRHISFRVSDQNGEAFLAREGAHAIARLCATPPGAAPMAEPKLLTLADKLGEVGAATGVVALAYLSRVMQLPNRRPGPMGLVHLSQDNGRRCVLVVRATGAHPF